MHDRVRSDHLRDPRLAKSTSLVPCGLAPAFMFAGVSSLAAAWLPTSGRGSLRARVCRRRRCSFCLEATAPLRMAALRIALSLTSLAALSERLKLSLV